MERAAVGKLPACPGPRQPQNELESHCHEREVSPQILFASVSAPIQNPKSKRQRAIQPPSITTMLPCM